MYTKVTPGELPVVIVGGHHCVKVGCSEYHHVRYGEACRVGERVPQKIKCSVCGRLVATWFSMYTREYWLSVYPKE